MATEALTLQGVDALYGDSHVLHGISFAVGAGRVLALLGLVFVLIVVFMPEGVVPGARRIFYRWTRRFRSAT